jgi:hypothetical protein
MESLGPKDSKARVKKLAGSPPEAFDVCNVMHQVTTFLRRWPRTSAALGFGAAGPPAAANLSAKEIREIITGVKKSAYDMPKSWSTEPRLRRVDLGSGPGIVVQGTSLLCGGTGNCQIWVFHKANVNWVPLFANDQTILAEGFNFGPAVSRQYLDELPPSPQQKWHQLRRAMPFAFVTQPLETSSGNRLISECRSRGQTYTWSGDPSLRSSPNQMVPANQSETKERLLHLKTLSCCAR